MTLHRDIHAAIWNAQNQANSLLWRGTERGIRYQGEADGLRLALRLINDDRQSRPFTQENASCPHA